MRDQEADEMEEGDGGAGKQLKVRTYNHPQPAVDEVGQCGTRGICLERDVTNTSNLKAGARKTAKLTE